MKRAFIVICLAAVLLSAGCNSPAETKDETGPGQVNVEEKTITTQKESTESTEPRGFLDDLKSLVAVRPVQYMVEYNIKTSMGGEPESDGRMAFYCKGADKVRSDTWMGEIESRTLMVGDLVVLCNKQSGKWSCMKMPQSENKGQDVNDNLDKLKDNIENNEVTQLPGRVVAGVNCKCFKYKVSADAPDENAAGLSEWDYAYCISPDGVPLYSESTSGETRMVMEALRYSTRVSDVEFDPPAEPKSMMEAIDGGGQNPVEDDMPLDQSDTVGDDTAGQDPSVKLDCSVCDDVPDEGAKQSCMKALNC